MAKRSGIEPVEITAARTEERLISLDAKVDAHHKFMNETISDMLKTQSSHSKSITKLFRDRWWVLFIVGTMITLGAAYIERDRNLSLLGPLNHAMLKTQFQHAVYPSP